MDGNNASKFSIAAVMMSGYTLIRYKGIHIEKKDWPRVIVIGSFGMGIYFALEAIGIAKVSSPMASLIMTLIPIFGLFADKPIYFNPDGSAVIVLIGMTILSIVLCDTMYAYAISKLSVTLVSLSENVIPLVTVFFAWLFLGTTLNPIQLVGGLVIIVSVTLITMKE